MTGKAMKGGDAVPGDALRRRKDAAVDFLRFIVAGRIAEARKYRIRPIDPRRLPDQAGYL